MEHNAISRRCGRGNPAIGHRAENCCRMEIREALFGWHGYTETAESRDSRGRLPSLRSGAGLPTASSRGR